MSVPASVCVSMSVFVRVRSLICGCGDSCFQECILSYDIIVLAVQLICDALATCYYNPLLLVLWGPVTGGCGPSLVTPMQNAFGGAHSLQSTLLALYPGTYLIAVAVFVFAFGFLPRDMRRVEEYYRKGSVGNGGLGVALLLPSEELEYDEGVDVVVGVPVDEGEAGLIRG